MEDIQIKIHFKTSKGLRRFLDEIQGQRDGALFWKIDHVLTHVRETVDWSTNTVVLTLPANCKEEFFKWMNEQETWSLKTLLGEVIS
jgi:hypothetical protein